MLKVKVKVVIVPVVSSVASAPYINEQLNFPSSKVAVLTFPESTLVTSLGISISKCPDATPLVILT